MTWGEILLILVAYCGSATNHDDCRTVRVHCIDQWVSAKNGKVDNGADAVNQCLSDPGAYHSVEPKPVPTASIVPNPITVPTPIPSSVIPVSGK